MRTVVLLGVALIVLAGLVWSLQRRLIYLPGGTPPPVAEVLPEGREVIVTTPDGLRLQAWFVPGGPTAVMLLPGNAGNRAGRVPLARELADAGLSVLLVDYRGYGGNPGSPTAEGLRTDARAAARWLAERPSVERLVYYGESLGAAVAIRLAAETAGEPGAETAPAALVLRSPFSSLVAMAREHYGPVPSWMLRDHYRSLEHIDAVSVPVLVVVGDRDRIVPPLQSRRIYAAAGEPKRLVVVPDAGHNDPALLTGRRLLEAVLVFLEDHGLLDRDPRDQS